MAPSRMLVLQVQEWLQIWETRSYSHRQVDEQPSKRSKNGDKSAVAMLKNMSHTIERRDPLCATHQIHDTWVAYSKI